MTEKQLQKQKEKEERAAKKLATERIRLRAMSEYEEEYRSVGLLCGLDEAGRGPLAGPVSAGACILPADCEILYLNDSKKVSPKKREALYDEIRQKAVAYGTGFVDPSRIDEIGILMAVYEAMRLALAKLSAKPDLLLCDAVTIPDVPIRQISIVHGDGKSVSIAAASILAKVERDRIMEEMDAEYPGYGFAKHKGYGTAEHIAAIKRLGPCPIHRRSFISHFL